MSTLLSARALYLLPILLFAVIAGYFLWGLNPDRNPRFIPSVMLSKPAPDFELPPLEGLATPGLTRADLLGGGAVLVNLFASWCVPCRAEHATLTRLVESEGVTLYGINYKNKATDAVAWLRELGNPYARIGADSGRVAIDWGVYGVPETFIVDGQGKIRFHHRGPLSWQDVEIDILPVLRSLAGD